MTIISRSWFLLDHESFCIDWENGWQPSQLFHHPTGSKRSTADVTRWRTLPQTDHSSMEKSATILVAPIQRGYCMCLQQFEWLGKCPPANSDASHLTHRTKVATSIHWWQVIGTSQREYPDAEEFVDGDTQKSRRLWRGSDSWPLYLGQW